MKRTKTHESHYARSLIEASMDPLIVISPEGRITDMNQAKVNITGIERKKLTGSNFFDYFTEPQKAREVYQEVFAKGSIADSPLTFRHKNGKLTDVLFNGSVYKDDRGNVLGAVVVARDIAEQKWAIELQIANKELAFQNEEKEKRASELIIANKELAFQNEEKEKRASELIIANKELVFQNEEKEKQEAANKELEAFSYSVSHDLRAPLRHIGGFVDLLIKNNSTQLDETGLRYLNTISESSHEMGDLIDALLTFSRLSRTELQRTKINSKKMVTRVLKNFNDELVGRNVEINISDLPNVWGDENLINQVWVNLISNALKYSRNAEKAVIEIGGKIENDKIIFYIKDNGTGFDMKFADKLFGVFQRLHKTKDFEGIGIGLANVNRIVVRHGGKCWAESEVGKGATFFFSKPNLNNH
ncbi:MAG: ATP-binding protein [Bacteroidota bacterium]